MHLMPRDSGDDAYEWMAARDSAAVRVDCGSGWTHKKTGRKVEVTLGGFLPTHEGSDGWIKYRYADAVRVRSYETRIERFMKRFKEQT